jgi:uncharacterized membrane protein AbrB (regulator of aidB expression)
MPKPLVTFLLFLLGALAGCLLLIVSGMLLGAIMLATYRHTHPDAGLGAVAGGLSEVSVLLVPILSGIIAVLVGRTRRRTR